MNKKYLFKVWITALIAAPVIIFILMLSNTNHDPDRDRNSALVGISFLVTALFGAALSIPAFVICYLLFPLLYQKLKNLFSLRVVISLIAAAVVFIATYLVISFYMSLIYGICFFISGLIYKVAPLQKPPPMTNN